MALWRTARWSRLPALTRLNRYDSTTAKDDYDKPEPPNGFLFNEKPLLPGEKREKEYWEFPFIYGSVASFVMIALIAVYRPDKKERRERARRKALIQLGELNPDS